MRAPIDYHCPDCGAEPKQPCTDTTTTHNARHGNEWSVSFADVSGLARQVHCYGRHSRDALADALASAGMSNITTQDLMVRRKNLLGGWFVEAIDTPLHLSPASETYHSM